ncbi:cellular communication network factor protein Ccn isoform 2-T7 [Glossina fuscipes fuscipes]
MHTQLVGPLLGIILNVVIQCVEANLTLGFKATKISGKYKPANCNVANTTYAHGETFKLDCKTQCVCENGRHACSSLCPKEQLPAPEDTISCRSPRLVEVPGHCCKMWLCENPIADVYATCHNSSSSPWTPCSNACGLGISTRFTTTTAGCSQLNNLRLCENRKCVNTNNRSEVQTNNNNNNNNNNNSKMRSKHRILHNLILSSDDKNGENYDKPQHKIRKGHECRSLQRLGPARVRLGKCVSRKLYRPKLCGRCHDIRKCCVPSVSTTIQVELLCPLNAIDPISYVEQQQRQQHHQGFLHGPQAAVTPLWDTRSLEPIDQEFLQSHQIQIENKFIAVEWILKCECNGNKNCHNNVAANTTTNHQTINNINKQNYNNDYNENFDNTNDDNEQQLSQGEYQQLQHLVNKPYDVYANNYGNNENGYEERKITGINKNHHNYKSYQQKQKQKQQQQRQRQQHRQWQHHQKWQNEWRQRQWSSSVLEDETQPDIIPYPLPLKTNVALTKNRFSKAKKAFENKGKITKGMIKQGSLKYQQQQQQQQEMQKEISHST